MTEPCIVDPVGTLEIAERLDVKDRTVHMWKFRGLLPPPTGSSVNGSPWWDWPVILRWAGDTGRLKNLPTLANEYRRRFKTHPSSDRRGKLSTAAEQRIVSGDEPAAELAEQYDVAVSTIYRIRRRAKVEAE